MKRILPVLLIVFLMACEKTKTPEELTQEIMAIEKAFDNMANEVGIGEAFLHFAAENATMLRNEKLIKGKAEIEAYFVANDYSTIKLHWKPDYVSVSASGDMAYTYGKYQFQITDTTGVRESEGVFHTVWERQQDGTWKFVWD